MPVPRSFCNAFTCSEVSDLSGLSRPMVNYLAKAGYLVPSYPRGRAARGATRYYSYRDLMVARVIGRLAAAGVELKRLKEALVDLQRAELWDRLGAEGALPLLITDGASIVLREPDGSVRDLTAGGQLAFAFVMDLARTEAELRSGMDGERERNFTYKVLPLRERKVVSA